LNREAELFDAARRLDTDAARAAFLVGACGGDHALHRRVEELLAAQAQADELFRPLSPLPSSGSPWTAEAAAGVRIDRYTLLEKLGEGGMGVVYRAEQREPVKRLVALKIIKLGMDTRQVVARFEAERQTLALMDHPNIARVLDGGTTGGRDRRSVTSNQRSVTSQQRPVSSDQLSADGGRRTTREPPITADSSLITDDCSLVTVSGRPYFVMELVEGVPITEFCGRHQLTLEQRLRLFIPVCQAVQHAHQKGIIHRDLKLSNVLVAIQDGVPVPKVIDFGVAKALHQRLTEKTFFTQQTTLIGTPAYMSPEQAEMSGQDVDTRSDIYGLGVLLYELLTRTQPFPEARLRRVAYAEMQRIILHEEPERPSTRLTRELALGSARGSRAVFGGPPKTPSVHAPAGVGVQEGRASGEPPEAARGPRALPGDGPEASSTSRARPGGLRAEVQALRGDLDWIVLKCLEKDRNRRYETANGLAADLRRFLEDEPVAARPPRAAYRFRKLVRRHRTASVAAALIALAVLLGGIVSGWALLRERTARRAALAFVGQVLTNVVPGVQRLTGATTVQDALGQATYEFAKRLRAGAETDPLARVTLARALIELSEGRNPGAANPLGRYEEGLKLAQEAVQLLVEPIPSIPEAERLFQLLIARIKAALSLYGLGRWEEGIALSEELEPLFDQLDQLPFAPDQARRVRRERWDVRDNTSYALLCAGHVERAVERFDLVLRSDWFRSIGETSNPDEQESLANTYDNLAVAQGLRH